MDWRLEFVAEGPVDRVALLDATWQGEPSWGADPWVALDAPDLVYEGPPFPGVLVRVGVPAGERLRVALLSTPPSWAPMRVCVSELIVGGHGFYLTAGHSEHRIELETGNYSLDVWVDPVAPGRAAATALVLGTRRPRTLPSQQR